MAELSVNEASQVEARKTSNLAFAFFCMEDSRARDIEVFYAYCRILDDIADEEGRTAEEKIAALNDWKAQIEAIYSGRAATLSKMAEEVRDVIMRRDIPKQYMLDVIDGVMRDTDPKPFETVEEIHRYCYGVACAVGLVSIYIFGCKSEKTKDYALALGYAFQFTNILRDVIYDWKKMGRVYIPKTELDAFGVCPEIDFDKSELSANCKELFRLMHFRAKHYFNRARNLLQPEDAKALLPAFVMGGIYERILDTIYDSGFEISENVVKFSKAKKIALALSAMRKMKNYTPPAAKNFGHAAVFGAGVGGIAAAVNLSLKGYEVDLFEAKANAGGRVAALEWKRADVRIDNASHALMSSCSHFFELLDTLGVGGEDFFKPAERMQFLFKSGKIFEYKFPLEKNAWEKLFYNIFELPNIEGFDKYANLKFLLKLRLGFGEASENETVSEYLERHDLGEVAVKLLWEPFCLAVQNTPIAKASAKMFRICIAETLLKGADKSALILNKKPIADILWPRAKYYLEACGGKVHLSTPITAINVEGKKVKSFTAGDIERDGYDYHAIALPHAALEKLLPECELKKTLAGIKDSPILNIYFSTKRKLFDGEFLGFADSSLHWIFNRTASAESGGLYFYSITVSAFEGDFDVQSIRDSIAKELKEYFGEFEFEDFLPGLFKTATIVSDCQTEALRPAAEGHFENASLVGDWVGCGLPATLENAVKSANFQHI